MKREGVRLGELEGAAEIESLSWLTFGRKLRRLWGNAFCMFINFWKQHYLRVTLFLREKRCLQGTELKMQNKIYLKDCFFFCLIWNNADARSQDMWLTCYGMASNQSLLVSPSSHRIPSTVVFSVLTSVSSCVKWGCAVLPEPSVYFFCGKQLCQNEPLWLHIRIANTTNSN